ncbi:Fe-S metabolism protein SufE [Longibacter salinarum]|uniref:Fe-S metabolism protein SufE n=1 Tax=Longibacter salinarum TaxID=1850348 RepID=A0A2A8CZ86_9BACT|nr:SufE family protein [Longibacter salinarum]PEN13956.1 Fe-S metabolism protein SufE [Longibacter salinarum]
MPTTAVDDRAQEIVDEFAFFPDWMSRYQYLIEMGDEIPLIDEAYKTDEYRIHGCQSKVWIRTDYDESQNVLTFKGDSNAKITKGLAALIIRVLDKQPPAVVENATFDFLDEIGMREHLSSQRNNGLAAMIEQMKTRASRYS